MEKNKPLISIIIPTFNCVKKIEKCILSIKSQLYKNYEIIVVDQESTDGTIDVAKKLGAKVFLTKKPRFYSPPSKSRNIGAKHAKGQVYFHMDSDMLLTKNILTEISKIFKNIKIGAVIVHEKDITGGYWSKCKALERRLYWGDDYIESARIVRSTLFRKIGGYDEKISSGEDFDIQSRYKKVGKVSFAKNVIRHDLSNFTFWGSVVKKYNYGKTATKYFKRSGDGALIVLKKEILNFVRNRKLIFKNPKIGLGMVVLKSAELFAGGLGILMSK